MKWDIRDFTPALLEDYIRFFDKEAQYDKPEWEGCRCIHFHLNAVYEAAYKAGTPFDEISRDILNKGLVRGHLAFSDGKIIGWVNTNDKSAYDRLLADGALWADDKPKTKAAVCFLVRPDMRRQGIAAALLAHAVAKARQEGYAVFEGYPAVEDCDEYEAHHGTVDMFEKQGFVRVEQNGRVLMRKVL